VLALAIAGGWATGCGGKQAPATGPGSAPPPAVAPAGRARAPATALQGSDAVAAVAAAAVAVATDSAASAVPAAPARPPAPAPLVGPVTRAAVEDYETWKTLRAQDYTPDAAAVKTIAARGKDVQVLAIVATWCPDSKREVPRFFKIYDLAGLGVGQVTLVAVDRSKKDAEGLTVKHDILRVPTFVFFRGDKEIGRVIERAVTTLENDIAVIVAK
jgi:thiol-disulfide isomerase/thioredoxin